jgi:alpha-L-fucosidase
VYGEGPTQVSKGSFTDTLRKEFTGADIRFTTRENTLYAFILGWPKNGEVRIRSLGRNLRLYPGRIGSVELLGFREPLKWSHSTSQLRAKLPSEKSGEYAHVLKITPRD